MPAQKISVATTKLKTAKPAKKEQAVTIQVDRAYAKPNWDVERNVAERALWQVVALALNINPLPDCVAERKKLDSVWKIEYNKTVTAMCELLLPVRQVGKIYYDQIKPTNSSRAGDRAKLKFIRVDVATATACLIKHIGQTKLPPGFQEMHEHLASLSKSSNTPNDLAAEVVSESKRAPKSQAGANETKASNALKILLYAVVQSQYGWDELDEIDKNTTLVKIERTLDLHQLTSRRSLSQGWIEDAIVRGSELAPLRPKTAKTV